jgi:hypothetical protein
MYGIQGLWSAAEFGANSAFRDREQRQLSGAR